MVYSTIPTREFMIAVRYGYDSMCTVETQQTELSQLGAVQASMNPGGTILSKHEHAHTSRDLDSVTASNLLGQLQTLWEIQSRRPCALQLWSHYGGHPRSGHRGKGPRHSGIDDGEKRSGRYDFVGQFQGCFPFLTIMDETICHLWSLRVVLMVLLMQLPISKDSITHPTTC